MILFCKSTQIREGMVNAKTIYDENGRVLLRKGNHLSKTAVKIIQEKGFRGVYIEEENSKLQAPLPEPLIEDTETIRIVALIKKLYERKEIIEDIYDSQYVGLLAELYEEVGKIRDTLEKAYQEENLIFELSDGRSMSNWLPFHCFNTCLLAISIAIVQGKQSEEIKDIGFAALVHDLGKSWYGELVNKEGLSEEEKEKLKGHVDHIYRVLQQQNYSIDVLQGVREHHEKLDGSGYPHGLSGNRIFASARIVSAANAYDNLTSINPYGEEKLLEAEAINHMSISGFYDPEAVNTLMKIVARYPVGTRVLLSSGSSGCVIKNTMGYPERPTVATSTGIIELTDMSKYASVTITKVLDEIEII